MMGRTPELTAIEERYPDEWVDVHVTKWDRDGFALDGNVVVHDPNPDIVHEQVRPYKRTHKSTFLYLFYTGRDIPPGWSILPSPIILDQWNDLD